MSTYEAIGRISKWLIESLKLIPNWIESVSMRIRMATLPFVKTRGGKVFLSLVLIGPITFLPTVYMAWTAPNIDSLRTLTWPMLAIVNLSGGLSVVHNGDWRMQVISVIWFFLMGAVYLATIVR